MKIILALFISRNACKFAKILQTSNDKSYIENVLLYKMPLHLKTSEKGVRSYVLRVIVGLDGASD